MQVQSIVVLGEQDIVVQLVSQFVPKQVPSEEPVVEPVRHAFVDTHQPQPVCAAQLVQATLGAHGSVQEHAP